MKGLKKSNSRNFYLISLFLILPEIFKADLTITPFYLGQSDEDAEFQHHHLVCLYYNKTPEEKSSKVNCCISICKTTNFCDNVGKDSDVFKLWYKGKKNFVEYFDGETPKWGKPMKKSILIEKSTELCKSEENKNNFGLYVGKNVDKIDCDKKIKLPDQKELCSNPSERKLLNWIK